MEFHIPFEGMVSRSLLGMIRVAMLLFLFPILGAGIISGMARNVVIVSLSCVVFPVVFAPDIPEEIRYPSILLYMAKEAVVGALLAIGASLFVWCIIAAGNVIDRQRGSMSDSFQDVTIRSQQTSMGLLVRNLVTILFFVSGIYKPFLETFYLSYEYWPIEVMFPDAQGLFIPFLLKTLDDYFMLALTFGAPFIMAIFFVDISLGMINRFAPQLEVFFLGMPIKTILALMIVYVYMQQIGAFIINGLHEQNIFLERLMGVFRSQ